MESKIILSNIVPFNDMFYKSCFYHSLFPIIGYYGKSIMELMVNDVIVYEYNENIPVPLGVEYMPTTPLNVLLDEVGIRVRIQLESNDIVNDMITAISKRRPVILWVDSFYEPFREDTYQKKHLLHTLLIYGFCLANQKFYIIEHDHEENLSYDCREISFDDLMNAYKGYFINYGEYYFEIPSYNEYYTDLEGIKFEDASKKKALCIKQYATNMIQKKSILFERLEFLKKFPERFIFACKDEISLSENVDSLISSCNNIINAKLATRYVMAELFNDNKTIIMDIDAILDNWNFIRAHLARYKFSLKYKKEAIESSITKLEQLFQLECNFNDKLFLLLEKVYHS